MKREERLKMVEAANLIKKICKNNFDEREDCNCPFAYEYVCILASSCPNSWEYEEEE